MKIIHQLSALALKRVGTAVDAFAGDHSSMRNLSTAILCLTGLLDTVPEQARVVVVQLAEEGSLLAMRLLNLRHPRADIFVTVLLASCARIYLHCPA